MEIFLEKILINFRQFFGKCLAVVAVYPHDGGADGRSFLDGRVVGGAVGEDGFVVVNVGDEDDHDGRRRVRGSVGAAAGAVVDGGHVELVLVAVEVDGAVVQPDDTGQLFDDELTGSGAAADEPEADVVAVLVGRHYGGHQRVGSGVLVHVGRVDALRELGLLVVLVLGVDAHGGHTTAAGLSFILGGDGELVVGVVVVGVQLLGVGDDPGGVDGEALLRHRVLDLGVGPRIAVGRLDFQDRRADGNVLVDVVRLVVGQLEFRHVVVHVRHSNRKL